MVVVKRHSEHVEEDKQHDNHVEFLVCHDPEHNGLRFPLKDNERNSTSNNNKPNRRIAKSQETLGLERSHLLVLDQEKFCFLSQNANIIAAASLASSPKSKHLCCDGFVPLFIESVIFQEG